MTRQLLRPQLAQTETLQLAPPLLVDQCTSGAMALHTTVLSSGYSQETLAERIGKPREVLSRACNGRGGLDPDVLISVMNQSGSLFLLQYMAKQLGYVLERDEYQAQLAELDRQKAEIIARRQAA